MCARLRVGIALGASKEDLAWSPCMHIRALQFVKYSLALKKARLMLLEGGTALVRRGFRALAANSCVNCVFAKGVPIIGFVPQFPPGIL